MRHPWSGLRLWMGMAILLVGLGLGGFPRGEVWAEDPELSPQQIQALKDLRQEFQQEQKQIRLKILEARLEMKTLSREELAGEKGETLRREIRRLMLRARERALFYRRQAFQLLTPEQQEKVQGGSSLGFHCPGPHFRRGGERTGPGRHEAEAPFLR